MLIKLILNFLKIIFKKRSKGKYDSSSEDSDSQESVCEERNKELEDGIVK
jgi:hypothetical protein